MRFDKRERQSEVILCLNIDDDLAIDQKRMNSIWFYRHISSAGVHILHISE